MRLRIIALLATLLFLPLAPSDRCRAIDMAEFGRVQLMPGDSARDLAIVFSGANGPGEADRQAVHTLGGAGFAVAAIDTRQALRDLGKPGAPRACIDLGGPLEWLTSTAERDLGWERFRPPLLLGHGAGAGLVQAALAQAPLQSFAGGIGVDLQPVPGLGSPLCHLPGRGRQAATALPGCRWFVAKRSPSAPANDAADSAGPLAAAYLRAARELSRAQPDGGSALVADLPLVEVSGKTTIDTLAVIYSGDGGWRDIDKKIGEVLATRGLAVVGVDSLRYFWSAQTPEQVGADLARILTHYRSAWHVRHVVLVGYSFGADILPFAYNRLPAELQRQVMQMSLIAPGRAADFEIRPMGWFGAGPSTDARPIPPETARIDAKKMQCIFGRDDAGDSLCTDAAARGMDVFARPGGHHFDNAYDSLANIVLTGGCRRGIACRT